MYGDEGESFRHAPPHEVNHSHQQQQQQRSGGLSRFYSAPNGFFQTLLDDGDRGVGSINGFIGTRSDEILSDARDLEPIVVLDQEQSRDVVLKHEMKASDALLTDVNGLSGSSAGGSLLRQSSSPADFFSCLFDDNVGFASYRGNSQVTHHTTHKPMMPSIPEFQHLGAGGSIVGLFEKEDLYGDCWEGTAALARNGNSMFTVSNEFGHQNGFAANGSSGLIHQMSLPSPSELVVMDKYLRFQDSPTLSTNTRAKRGFATHPRSIAERVRRTRISERMRKLQQLFPNIDKQTNTAQMLDMASDYIKDLQKEVQTLTHTREKCKCLKNK